MSQQRPAPDLDAEQEVDLRSLWTRISRRWWLPVGGLVVGAILGILLSVGGGEVYRAKALLYMGQPFTTSGGGQIQSLATNPKTVSEIIRSESALKRAAAASGLRVGQLRGNVTSQAVVSTGQARTVSPLIEVVVEAPAPVKAEKAAEALANVVIAQVSTYVDRKIALLEKQIASSNLELRQIDKEVSDADAQLQQIRNDKSLSSVEKLISITGLNSTIGFKEQRRGTVQQELFQNQQLLSLAQNVEKSGIVQQPVATRTTATSRRNTAVIGALVGLLLGALAAYLADPVLQRRGARIPAA